MVQLRELKQPSPITCYYGCTTPRKITRLLWYSSAPTGTTRCYHSYLTRLPWIFPGVPLKVNGAPGNIQDNLTGVITISVRFRVHEQSPLSRGLPLGQFPPFPRWGIILRSTVRTYDISWFSWLLLLQNGSQTDPRFRFAQKTASEKVFSSILAANKCCQSTAGYVSFETK